MEVEINEVKLKVYENGNIERYFKKHGYKLMMPKPNKKSKNYIRYVLKLNNKTYLVHRIIAFVYKQLDINNKQMEVDHIDNLRIVSHQQNMFNIENTKGYRKRNDSNTYQAEIKNGDIRITKSFKTEEDAKQWYLNKKKDLHVFD